MHEPTVHIRPFRIADYPIVYALWEKTENVGLNESDSREATKAFLRRNPRLSLVATSNGRPIAAVLCGHDGRRGYLHHMAVARKWRRRGIGKALVTACLARLRTEGIIKCNIFVFAGNRPGLVFWRSLGWNVRSELRLAQRETASPAVACRTSC